MDPGINAIRTRDLCWFVWQPGSSGQRTAAGGTGVRGSQSVMAASVGSMHGTCYCSSDMQVQKSSCCNTQPRVDAAKLYLSSQLPRSSSRHHPKIFREMFRLTRIARRPAVALGECIQDGSPVRDYYLSVTSLFVVHCNTHLKTGIICP